LQHRIDVAVAVEERARLGHRHLEDVGDRASVQRYLPYFGTITTPVAVGTAQVNVGEELHFDVLEAVPAARRTPPGACVEAERARRVPALPGERRGGEALADRVECADVARRVRTRRAPDRRLGAEHDAP